MTVYDKAWKTNDNTFYFHRLWHILLDDTINYCLTYSLQRQTSVFTGRNWRLKDNNSTFFQSHCKLVRFLRMCGNDKRIHSQTTATKDHKIKSLANYQIRYLTRLQIHRNKERTTRNVGDWQLLCCNSFQCGGYLEVGER